MTGHLTGAIGALYMGDPEPRSETWDRIHREGITGTDIPAITGDSTRANALTVWHAKRGTGPVRDDDPGEAAEWGNLLEPVVAERWRCLRGAMLLDGGIWQHRDIPWMRAQVDRVVATCPDTPDQERILCGLEVKTRNAFVAGRWRDDVPDDVLAQVAWQRMVTGLDHVHVACLVGGQKLVDHVYREDEQLEEYLFKAASSVWQCVVDDVPPPVEWDGILSELLDALVPDRAGTRELTTAEAVTLDGAWMAYQTAKRAAAALKGAAEAKIKSAMGAGLDGRPVEVLTYNGEPLFTYREQTRKGYTVGATSFRVLRRAGGDD